MIPVLVLPFALAVAAGDSTPAKPPAPKPAAVKVAGDVGYVSTSGNTSVQTLNLGDKVSVRVAAVTLSEQIAVIHGRSNGATVASSWRALARADLALEDVIAAYGSVTYERNVFAGLASRVSSTTGLSTRVVKSARDKLVVEGGISYTTQTGYGATGTDLEFFGGRAATAYVHQLGPRASISQSVELLPNFHQSADLRVNTESALLAPLTRQVAMKMSYVIHYDGVPEPGYQSTDRLFTSGIQVTL